jgi:TM2 domain-containing membrane protein YozV
MLPEDDDYTIKLVAPLTPNQRDVFYQEYTRRAKSYQVALLLSILFGWIFGFHKFYLGRIGQGILYIILSLISLSLIPLILTIFDIVKMRETVTKINRQIAERIADRVRNDVAP